jgi:hypothetical protein
MGTRRSFPPMSIAEHAALRDFWQQAGGVFWQRGGLSAGLLRRRFFERVVKHNLSLARLAELTPLRLFSYLRACQSDSRELIRAAQVFPRDQY